MLFVVQPITILTNTRTWPTVSPAKFPERTIILFQNSIILEIFLSEMGGFPSDVEGNSFSDAELPEKACFPKKMVILIVKNPTRTRFRNYNSYKIGDNHNARKIAY